MKNIKRTLASLLAVVMLLALAPVSVRATDDGLPDFSDPVTATSGTCGENLTWKLDSGSVLTISGTGDMDFGYDGCPWYDHLYNITSVVMEEGVTSIEDDAFNRCQNMTTVTIPDSVTSIGQSAFRECYSLREVSISRNVTYIGGYAFQFCNRMTGINVASGNPNYSSDSMGALYNKKKTELIRVPGGFYGTFVVPDTVTTITPSAFQSCESLYGVELPDSVTSIGVSTFLFCESLRKITIPASVTSIDDYAFGACQNLTEITFEGDAPSIKTDAFMNVTATANYPAGNATWTDEVKKNYGGTITWVPYSDEAAIPTLTLKYPTLSFESEVFYNVYFDVTEAEVAVEDLGLLTWYEKPASLTDATVENAEYNIPGGTYNADSGEYMVRTQGIPAMRMGDDLYLRVYAKLSDGTYAYSDVTYYSAKFYANDMLTNSQSASTKALCVAMLNYGAAAQQHFGHNTDNLMNAHLTEEQKNLVAEWSSDMMSSVILPDAGKVGDFVSNGGFSGGYPSVSFDGAFAINYFFTAKHVPDDEITLYCWNEDTYNSADVLTEENADKVTYMQQTATADKYIGSYAGVAAKDIDKTVFVAAVYEYDGVRYSSPVIAYSLSAYCQDRIDNGSDTMKALAMETAVYGHYAENYFTNLSE